MSSSFIIFLCLALPKGGSASSPSFTSASEADWLFIRQTSLLFSLSADIGKSLFGH